jgi:hypothetical protein
MPSPVRAEAATAAGATILQVEDPNGALRTVVERRRALEDLDLDGEKS